MKEKICPNCGTKARPRKYTKGSIIIELFAWICFIVPGLFYSLWRLSSRYEGCPECKGNMIPLNSPMAKKLVG